MNIEDVRVACQTAVNNIASSIADYAVNSETDFSRNRKLPAVDVLRFLITKGDESTKNELWDLTCSQENAASAPALVQQRGKLKAEGVQALLYEFNRQSLTVEESRNASPFCFLAVDGSTFIFPSDKRYAGEEYYCQSQPGQRGTYSMHLTALYDLERCCYVDGTIQPLRMADERAAFCHICDTYQPQAQGEIPVFVADRGFESYNVFGHLLEHRRHFVIRCQETNIQRWVRGMDLPADADWDVTVDIDLTRSRSRQVKSTASVVRVLTSSTQFDFLERGSKDVYRLSLRVVRFPLDDAGQTWEYLVTNLFSEEFPVSELKAVYARRWGEEVSFRDLKYTIGALHFHAARPELVKQEIWGALIAYNAAELMAQVAAATKSTGDDGQVRLKANFSSCAHICRLYLAGGKMHATTALQFLHREMIPVRPGRHAERAMSKRIRRSRYFMYRTA